MNPSSLVAVSFLGSGVKCVVPARGVLALRGITRLNRRQDDEKFGFTHDSKFCGSKNRNEGRTHESSSFQRDGRK